MVLEVSKVGVSSFNFFFLIKDKVHLFHCIMFTYKELKNSVGWRKKMHYQ